jgi:hypothetical protein
MDLDLISELARKFLNLKKCAKNETKRFLILKNQAQTPPTKLPKIF